MSGIVGIVNLDGSAVECRVVHKLTDFLAFRGPDGRHTRIKDNVGLGHTLFKTTEECEPDWQPRALNGKTWIVADARIDARDELVAELNSAGQGEIASSDWTDTELILRAYEAWGENCVEHLLGDFAFGIWDDSRQHLFCARDHMGVKPFYYAQIGSCVVFSNTLECVREHPDVSDKLNDLAIADFLLFGVNQNPATTSFAEICRIPPAHCATWSRSGSSIRRYWSMPVEDALFYKRTEDYIDHFQNLLHKCVADRLRTNRVSIFMSGGIDSPTLAATAKELLQRRYNQFDLTALTAISSFAPDEGRYARTVAAHLNIPIHYRPPAEAVSENWEQIPFATPEPHCSAWGVLAERRFWQGLGTYSRVFLFGEGPDNALHFDWRPYASYLLRRRLYLHLLTSFARTVFSQGYPPFWFRIRNGFRPAKTIPVFPPWMESGLESRLRLRERWADFQSAPAYIHPLRPIGYASLQIPLWQAMFEKFDAATTRALFEVRHPFLDLRILRFMLTVPALPWCRSKHLVRQAMRGALPDEVLRRRKIALPFSPLLEHISRFSSMSFLPTSGIREYIDLERVTNGTAANLLESNLRARSLNHWLQNSWPRNHNHKQELFFGRPF
jgi:asparagine synthase (glutamine-hydrolysing)